ncbi:hypothetical protein P691DRAFT_768693 [Macrolepiota fuliginosa MF-IS2]|uniref:Uncharacterized protein n=1 Tax=Macrolepiota fuliginosa MF-IS2 TaxID=1400762 RepID=A0A9P5WW22_9AGAR|nr:hypothetical protein P691DRAFT_768693 [Macrolepiota fuliginosa MF-IS2]
MPEEDGQPAQQPPQAPNYVALAYQPLGQQVMDDTGISEEDAVLLLGRIMNQVRIQQGDCNGEDDSHAPPGPVQPPVSTPPPNKKKTIWITQDKMVSSNWIPTPSKSVLWKLHLFEYVELWHFTMQGCIEGSKATNAVNAETISITYST